MNKLLTVLTRIADALEESNEITRDIQQQSLAIAERQQQTLQTLQEGAKQRASKVDQDRETLERKRM